MDSLVSIGMPLFNAEKTLSTAIRSILNQTYSNWELILINDGSTDRSPLIAKGFVDPRIKFVSGNKRRGISARLNQAISLSKGKYFARMDSDDVSFPRRIELQVRFLESHSAVDLLGTGALVFSGDGIAKGILPVKERHEEICGRPWWGFMLPHPSWMGRIDWFLKHKYRSSAWFLKHECRFSADKAQDQDLLFRTYECSRFACLPQVLLGYRENERYLKKMLISRYAFFKAILLAASRENEYDIVLKLAILQPAKVLGDILNIGLGIKQMRNPLLPVGDELFCSWQKLWEKIA
jgi:glycosyltransferase involved in cell wall biosynthesis